jgi:hypothetical protein
MVEGIAMIVLLSLPVAASVAIGLDFGATVGLWFYVAVTSLLFFAKIGRK